MLWYTYNPLLLALVMSNKTRFSRNCQDFKTIQDCQPCEDVQDVQESFFNILKILIVLMELEILKILKILIRMFCWTWFALLCTPLIPSSTFCLLDAPYQVIGNCLSRIDSSICQAAPSTCQAWGSICHASTNQMSRKYQSTAKQVPINCQAGTNRLSSKYQSTVKQVDWYLLDS